jgi:hypothetical protein
LLKSSRRSGAKPSPKAPTATGFGYFPEPWSEGGRYGDSIVTLEYVRRRWTAFELVGVEVNAEDPYQIYAFLRPR